MGSPSSWIDEGRVHISIACGELNVTGFTQGKTQWENSFLNAELRGCENEQEKKHREFLEWCSAVKCLPLKKKKEREGLLGRSFPRTLE